jgi:flagellar hook-basal body complex protein FliE
MLLPPVSLSGATIPLPSTAGAGSASEARGASFTNVVDQLLGNAVQSDQQASAAVRDLATGQTDNLHGVLLQVAQADLSFRLILEIRNRLSDAFQEIMKMQV